MRERKRRLTPRLRDASPAAAGRSERPPLTVRLEPTCTPRAPPRAAGSALAETGRAGSAGPDTLCAVQAIEDEVRAVNEAFYRAFRERDLAAMERLWASEAPVACMHPGLSVLMGRDAVMRSWRGILRHPGAPTLTCSQVEVHLLGTSAFVTCLAGREGEVPKLIATNVFTLEAGRWRIVHHHAAPLATSAQRKKAKKPESEPPPDPFALN